MTDKRIEKHGLQVDPVLAEFIDAKALPGTGVDADVFWKGLSDLVHDFGPRNAGLLARREELQSKIDQYHITNRSTAFDRTGYEAFLREIGYLVPEGDDFEIETTNVDPEIAQLVVPITNARFALNAANARWGSLYDAFYGTDAMGSLPPKGGYDRGHGSRVVARTRVFLDQAFPIAGGSHADVSRYYVDKGVLLIDDMPLETPEGSGRHFVAQQRDARRVGI
jgi:malate synthase